MAKRLRVYRDFSYGLSEVANDNMPDNALVLAQNVEAGASYGIARANGTEKVFTQVGNDEISGKPVVLLQELATADGVQIIAFVENSTNSWSMFIWDESAESWTVVEDSTSGTATTSMLPILSHFVYAGKMYWLDGTRYCCWDGTALSEVVEDGSSGLWDKVKTARCVAQRGTRWFFGTADNEIIFSNVGYVNKFGATDLVNISSGMADQIYAVHEYSEGLLIFQARSVFFLSGWDFASGTDIELRRLNVSCGTRYPRSVKTVENAVLYVGRDGLYRLSVPTYSETIAAKNVSEQRIQQRILDSGATDYFAEVWNGKYYLGLRTENGCIEYRFDTSTGAFYGEYTQGAYCYAAALGGENYLFIGCDNGYVLRYDRNSYHYINIKNGGKVAIPVVAQTKGYDVVGAMVQYAKLKRAFFVVRQYAAESSAIFCQLKADYADKAWQWSVDFDESLVYAEGYWGDDYWGWKDTVTKEVKINQKAQRLQYNFYADGLDEPLLIYGVGVLYKPKKVRGSRDGVSKADAIYD